MKRPVKENITKDMDSIEIALTIQWNDCCDDWEKWTEKCQEDFISVSSLPSCKEIEEIMTDHYWDSLEGERGILERHCKFLAKAIHKRLRGE